MLESFFPPWPADLIALYAGFLAGRGVLTPWAAFGVAIAGTQAGVMAAFWLARRWGRALLLGPLGRFVHADRLARLEAWFARWGAPAIALSRFVPAVRALVTPAAALAGFAAWKVWVFAGSSVIAWNFFVVGLGLLAGRRLEWATGILMRYNTVALALLGLALAACVLGLMIRRPARRA